MPVSVYMRGSKTSGSGRCMPHGRGGWDEGNGAGRPFRSQARRTSGGALARPRDGRASAGAPGEDKGGRRQGSKTSGSGCCMPHGRGGWDDGNGAGRPFRSQARRTSGGALARPRQRRQQSEALLLSLTPSLWGDCPPHGGIYKSWPKRRAARLGVMSAHRAVVYMRGPDIYGKLMARNQARNGQEPGQEWLGNRPGMARNQAAAVLEPEAEGHATGG